jgi:hypothetical protein
MSWRKIISSVEEFETVYARLRNRINTAHDRKEELYWKNYKRWYTKLAKQTKSALRRVKKDLAHNSTLVSILRNLESSFTDIFKIETRTNAKWEALKVTVQIWEQFRSELDRQIKSGYDMFRTREFEPDPKLCFVMMPFDDPEVRLKPLLRVYRVIRATVRRAKLKCKRADEIFGVKPIVQDIWEYINKASLTIADLTGRNTNVFYEVGLSHALPKKVIFLTQTMEDVPFDIKYIRCIVYKNTDAGRRKLANDLYRTIKTVLA